MPQTYSIDKNAMYGHWKVVEPGIPVPSEEGKRKRHYCKVRCMKCGDIYTILTTSMVSGRSTQCTNCRARDHGDKVRTTPSGISVQVRISTVQRDALCAMFGGDRRAVGRGARKALAVYRRLVEVKLVDIPAGETFAATTISIDEHDRDWLKNNHQSIHHGLYCAIDYFLSIK